MLKSLVVAALALSAGIGPSFAQDMTTLQYLLAKGAVIHAQLQGQAIDLPVTYSSDGTSSMKVMGRLIDGRWRVDGDRFCASNEVNPVESCFAIPEGKKPGDTFKVMTPAMGEATLEINK